jgi:hypothetical protein
MRGGYRLFLYKDSAAVCLDQKNDGIKPPFFTMTELIRRFVCGA